MSDRMARNHQTLLQTIDLKLVGSLSAVTITSSQSCGICAVLVHYIDFGVTVAPPGERNLSVGASEAWITGE
jgi:hypothetical protein